MASMSPSQKLAAFAVLICGALWGLFWIPMRWLDSQSVGGGWTSLTFAAISALSALPWLRRKEAWSGLSRQWLSGLLMGGGFALYAVALVLTDVVNAILLFYLMPVWATLAGWAFRGERLTASRVIAIILGFGGMACILGIDKGLPLPRNVGDWLALASGISWAAGSIYAFARPTQAIALPVFTFSIGALVVSLLAVAIAACLGSPVANAGSIANHLPAIFVIAMVIFVPPNALVLWATQRIDPGRVGILLTTEVLVGAISAAILSGEDFGRLDAAGTVLIVAAGLTEVLSRRG